MSNQTYKDLAKLARAIYEVVLSEENRDTLVQLDGLALKAKSIFDDCDNKTGKLHPDLGFNIAELVVFKIEGAHDMYEEYKDYARETIEYLEEKYDIVFSRRAESHQQEKNLVKLARSLFNLVDHESNLTVLATYRQLLLEATSVFDDYYNSTGKLHADLGGELFEFNLFKMDGVEKDTESYKQIPKEIIENLEKKYGAGA